MAVEYREIGDVDGIPVRVPVDYGYRTCAVCGADCDPDVGFSSGSGEHGARTAFMCPEHGTQSLIDPFENLR